MAENLSRKFSKAWLHFELVNKDKAKCSYCREILSVKNGSSSSLVRHLRTKHSQVHLREMTKRAEDRSKSATSDAHVMQTLPDSNGLNAELEPSRPPEPPSAGTSLGVGLTPARKQSALSHYFKKPVTMAKQIKMDRQVVKWVAKRSRPLNIVNDQELQELLSMAEPGYTLPSRKTLTTSLIPAMYEDRKELLVKSLVEEAQCVSLTTDCWTSINDESFMAVTCHWLAGAEMKEALLECKVFPSRHTIDHLSEGLRSVAQQWGLSDKIACIVSDNAANIVGAVCKTGWRHLGCLAHTLNLAVQKSLEAEGVNEVLKKAKDIVRYFKKSGPAKAELKKTQEEKGMPGLKMKQECPTRWNSAYEMVRRLLANSDAVNPALASMACHADLNSMPPDSLTRAEWQTLQEIADSLAPFDEVTQEMSSEKKVTLSKVIPLTALLKGHVEAILKKVITPGAKNMVACLQKECRERFKRYEDNELLVQATLLDPRFKKTGFFNPIAAGRAVENLKRKVTSMPGPPDGQPGKVTTSASVTPTPKQSLLWGTFDKEMSLTRGGISKVAQGYVEVDKYLSEVAIMRKEDPLKWWMDRQSIYPRLFTLVQRRFCIPATSVPSERVFSKAGVTLNERRTRLSNNKLSELLFLQANLP